MWKVVTILISFVLFFTFPNLVFADGTPVQSNSSYTTPSGMAASDGTSTETISIHLQDENQNPVIGNMITISSSNNSAATFPKNDQVTDSNGNATFTVATTTPGAVKITMFDSTSNTTFTDWFSITFYDADKGCSNIPTSPILSSVVSNSNNTATLTWVNSASPVNNYLVSYGLTSKNYSYGNPNVGGQGTTSYTINSLGSGKTYYFVVSANNNCGTSGFSNEVSVVVKPLPKTPSPTSIAQSTPMPTPITVVNVPVSVDVESPTPIPNGTLEKKNINFKDIGIGIIASGFLLISVALFYQVIQSKKKNAV